MIGGNSKRSGYARERQFYFCLVVLRTYEETYRRIVFGMFDVSIDSINIEIQLGAVLWNEWRDFEFHDDIATKSNVIE